MTHYADGDHCTVFQAVSTAIPKYSVSQLDAAEFMLRTTGLSERIRKRIPQIYTHSGIDRRHTVVADYTRNFEDFDFYPQTSSLTPSPSTKARNDLYQSESVPLATNAAAKCLADADCRPSDVTHLIVVSCTGFFAPGLDIHLVKNLGLRADIKRTIIGFMGCYAAFNALRVADSVCRSDRNATVLIVCVELCTVHFQIENSLESVIVNALFSDGAAAVLMKRVDQANAVGKLIYRGGHSLLADDSLDAMSWMIGDTGFIMGLSSSVPETIGRALPKFVNEILQENRISKEDIGFWAVHPGGRQILDTTSTVMNLEPKEIEDSYAVLRENGNMSSPTILYILERIMSKPAGNNSSNYGIGLAFGPGLTIEGCLLEVGL